MPAPTPLRIFQVFGCANNNNGIGEFDIHSGPLKTQNTFLKEKFIKFLTILHKWEREGWLANEREAGIWTGGGGGSNVLGGGEGG